MVLEKQIAKKSGTIHNTRYAITEDGRGEGAVGAWATSRRGSNGALSINKQTWIYPRPDTALPVTLWERCKGNRDGFSRQARDRLNTAGSDGPDFQSNSEATAKSSPLTRIARVSFATCVVKLV